MLNKFTLRHSTYNTFVMFGSPGREMVPFPFICDLLPSPKVTFPHFLNLKTLKREWSPIICLEHPLSRYHKHMSITLNVDFIIKHSSRLLDKSVGMVFSLSYHLWEKPLIFTLLRRTPLHIFILRQSSLVFCHTKTFFNNHQDSFQISFRLTFSETLNQIEIRKARCIWNKRSLHATCSHNNRGQWIT